MKKSKPSRAANTLRPVVGQYLAGWIAVNLHPQELVFHKKMAPATGVLVSSSKATLFPDYQSCRSAIRRTRLYRADVGERGWDHGWYTVRAYLPNKSVTVAAPAAGGA